MNRRLIALLAVTTLALAGCGSGTPTVVTQILSDPVYDGDIAKDAVTGAYTVTQGSTQSVFAGIDPGTNTEYRAFLDFPLSGWNGVPFDAVITSATLDIVISNIIPQPLTGPIPIRFDLVSFQPPTLIGSDYDRTIQPPLATIMTSISQADFGQHVFVDVTYLMAEAQRLGLPDFQIRILEDLGNVSAGRIEINDTTGPNRALLAPLLQVTYF